MQKEFHERYEYARNRIKEKKFLYYHFIFFIIGSLFMFVANELLEYGLPTLWYKWAIVIWFFIFTLHFIRVYITKRFMNKAWEQQQIEHLIAKQDKKIEQLNSKLDSENQNKFS
ncbi:2TM domain-containing protein [Flavobacterium antarcticum]|uniref:2TM domain-containing protein n=1 Tax=Flavobacterium antarcticum TaxID=271155 RepID=UPI0003B5C953|nr:2TM domain-containing protein [Flavobacterium antarcticum]